MASRRKRSSAWRIWGHVFGQELQSHKAIEPGVLSLVDDPHAAAAQLLDDAVVRDGLADQWRGFHPRDAMLGMLMGASQESRTVSFDGANLCAPSLDKLNAASAESLHSGVSASQFAHITSDPHSSCHPPSDLPHCFRT